MYSRAVANENYLRGVQEANGTGVGHLQEHLPGRVLRPLAAHPLRGVPEPGQGHLREQQDRDVAARPAGGHLQDGLRDRRVQRRASRNLARTSLTSDNVFSDGWTSQLATVTGSVEAGYVANLTVPV